MHPILLKLGPINLYSYGFMLMLAFVAGILWALREARSSQEFTASHVVDCCLWLLIGSIAGARILFVLLNWQDYAGNPGSLWRLDKGGLSFHGGLLFGTLAVIIYTRIARVSLAGITDLLTPSIPLGYGLARIGCFLNGCCAGRPTSVPWAVRSPNEYGLLGPPSHPTQLYGTLSGLLMFGILVLLKRRGVRRGELFPLFLILYSVYRFLNEFFRREISGQPLAGLDVVTQAQLASVLTILACTVWLASRPEPLRFWPALTQAQLVAGLLMVVAAMLALGLPARLMRPQAGQGLVLALILGAAAALTVAVSARRPRVPEAPPEQPTRPSTPGKPAKRQRHGHR
jgi:phosphatidylglycerol:prolipoprotein diacylglycerol transferase